MALIAGVTVAILVILIIIAVLVYRHRHSGLVGSPFFRGLPLSEPRVDTPWPGFLAHVQIDLVPRAPFPNFPGNALETGPTFEDHWPLKQFFKDAINSFDRDKSNSGKESKEKRVRIN